MMHARKLPSSSDCGVASGSDPPLVSAPSRTFDGPTVAQDGPQTVALEDLELLHKCGIPVCGLVVVRPDALTFEAA